MYDDFFAGYNFGKKPQGQGQFSSQEARAVKEDIYEKGYAKIRQQRVPGVYDKSLYIRMTGPNGETGEIYANGKMYIVAGPGKGYTRKFGSRPYAIRYMQQKGWVLL
jgi:hypothetical protein